MLGTVQEIAVKQKKIHNLLPEAHNLVCEMNKII